MVDRIQVEGGVQAAARFGQPSICFLTRRLDTGGAERQLVLTAKGLQALGWRVCVLTFYPGGHFDHELVAAGVAVHSLHKRGRWDVLPFWRRLRQALAAHDPDVLYCFLSVSNILGAWAHGRARLIWSIRASNMDLGRYDWTAKLVAAIERALSRRPHRIIANSRAGAQFAIQRGFPKGRVQVVTNGVDTQRFRPDSGTRRRMRAAWDVAETDLVIGVLARLDPMKGFETLIRAASILAPDARWRIVIAGEGPPEYRAKLQSLAEGLGIAPRLTWLGRSERPQETLNGFDLYCSASAFGEGFSNSIAEAMACGLPVVATDVGDSAFIVADHGRVVPPGDPAALASALGEAMAGSWRAEAIRRRIVDNFSFEALIARTQSALLETS